MVGKSAGQRQFAEDTVAGPAQARWHVPLDGGNDLEDRRPTFGETYWEDGGPVGVSGTVDVGAEPGGVGRAQFVHDAARATQVKRRDKVADRLGNRHAERLGSPLAADQEASVRQRRSRRAVTAVAEQHPNIANVVGGHAGPPLVSVRPHCPNPRGPCRRVGRDHVPSRAGHRKRWDRATLVRRRRSPRSPAGASHFAGRSPHRRPGLLTDAGS